MYLIKFQKYIDKIIFSSVYSTEDYYTLTERAHHMFNVILDNGIAVILHEANNAVVIVVPQIENNRANSLVCIGSIR